MATPAEFWNWNLTILVAFFAVYTFTRDLVFEDANKAWKALYYALALVVGIAVLIAILISS